MFEHINTIEQRGTLTMLVTERDIEALLDNELSHEQGKVVMDALQSSPRLRQHYDMIKDQKVLLKQWWEQYGKKHH